MITRRSLLCSGASLLIPSLTQAASFGLELNLLFDCSGSMYTPTHHAATQLRGHLDAFTHDDIVGALIANRTVVRCVLWNTTALMVGTPVAITSPASVNTSRMPPTPKPPEP